MKIGAAFQQTLESQQQFLVALGVVDPACRENQFATFFGVLNNQLSMTFNGCAATQLLNHIG